ncbi:MAG TPA: hypothetical protein DER01_04570 [Phycisphaerales bacterium]|nr:hypothetical protein [Phycisphaerales bacterium]
MAIMGHHMQKTTRQTIIGSLTLVVSLFVVYVQMRHAGIIWDDHSYLTGNTLIQSLTGLWTLWTVPGAHPQYYPLVFTSYFLEYQLWGLNLGGYHFVNILLHGISCLLLWRILTRLGLRCGWLAAMVFALHPVMVESVAWITERKNVLSLAFYLCGILAGIRLLNLADVSKPLKNKSQTTLWWCVLLLCYVLALLSKTVTVSLPAALLVMVWWRHGSISKRAIGLMLPLLAIGLALGLHTAHLEKVTVGAVGQDWDTSLLHRTLLAGQIVWFYILKLVYAHPLIFIYERWQVDVHDPMHWLPVVLLVVLLMGLLICVKKIGRGPLAGMLLFVGTLFPALGFFNVYPMRYSYVADHFQYHASIAMIVLIVCGLAGLLRTSTVKRIVLPLCVLGLVAMGYQTYQRTAVYQNHRILWLDTLDQNPKATIAIYNLGSLAMTDNRPADGLAILNMAVIAFPDQPLSYINRAAAYSALDMRDRQLADLRKAISCFKGYEIERAMPHRELGQQALREGDWQQAAGEFEQFIRCAPQSPVGYALLADALMKLEDYQRAKTMYVESLRRTREVNIASSTWYNLALAYQQTEQYEPAMNSYLACLNNDPKRDDAMSNLATLFAKTGDFASAINWQEKALAIHTTDAYQQNLVRMRVGYAMHFAKLGYPAQAIEHLELARKLAMQMSDPASIARIDQLIQALERKQ